MDSEKKFVTIFSYLAGLSDTSTGLGLVVFPSLTLGLMGVDAGSSEPSMVRFIGAFVLGTGSLYFWGAYFRARTTSWRVLEFTWLTTAWLRLVVAVVTGSMVVTGDLPLPWASVPITDAVLALFQGGWILLGKFPSDEK